MYLYRPTITSWKLPNGSYRTADGKRVTSKTPGAVRTVGKSKTWYGRYTDGVGEVHQVKLATSKEVARRMLAKLAGDAQLAGVGIVDRYAEHRAKPPAEHLDDYRRFLLAKADTPRHVAETAARIAAVLDGCAVASIDALDGAQVAEFIGGLRASPEWMPLDAKKEEYTRRELALAVGCNIASVARMLARHGLAGKGQARARRYPRATVEALQNALCRGVGAATCNHYLTAMKGFTRWLARGHRIPADPLAFLKRQRIEADARHPRRALRPHDFRRFIDATAKGRRFRGLTGADRLALYTLASETGFRASELASLRPESFDFDPERPTVCVEAAYSKHRRKDEQPIRREVAALFESYVNGRPAGQPLWPGKWFEDAAEMLRVDLVTAGIPYLDAQGRAFDFHAMRGQFISMLAASGVHPKVAQVLARHSTVGLTMDYYTHLDVFDVRGALDALSSTRAASKPFAGPQRSAPKSVVATG